MNPKSYQVSFKPDRTQLEQLNNWMIAENKQRIGFVHDLSIVTDHARNNRLATIISENEAIGFVTWDIFKRSGHIAVAAIASGHRRSGAGRYLMEALFTHLLQQSILALYLECAPAASEKFWKKMGFVKMPPVPGYANGDTQRLYLTLVPAQELGSNQIPYLQIFEYGSEKKQSYPLNYKPGTNELVKPIIVPAGGDWCIEHVRSKDAERPEKIKSFRSGSCFDDPFLIVTNL